MFKKFFQFPAWFVAILLVLGIFVGGDDKESPPVDKPNQLSLISDAPTQLKTEPRSVVKTKPKPVNKATPDKIMPDLPHAEAASLEPQKPTATALKASLPSPKAEIAWLGYKYISKNSVNVRTLPSVKSLKVGNLKLNTQLKYYQYTGGWYQIKLPNSQTLGWIRGDLLANDKRTSQSKPKTPLAIKSVKKAGPRRSPYYGTCDCPYDRTRKGARCGGRSAYSKPGGRSPVCYW